MRKFRLLKKQHLLHILFIIKISENFVVIFKTKRIAKMPNFKFVKVQLVNWGLYRLRSINESFIFNYKYLSILFSWAIITILMGIPLFKLKTFFDMSTGCFGFSVAVAMTFTSSVIMWQTQNIYKLIDNFEEIIQTREF